MFALKESDPAELKRQGHLWALMFLALGVAEFITMLGQAFLFGVAAERLTMRLRSKAFRNVMRMDIAYFDQPAHSSGIISTRLATDAPNVKSASEFPLITKRQKNI